MIDGFIKSKNENILEIHVLLKKKKKKEKKIFLFWKNEIKLVELRATTNDITKSMTIREAIYRYGLISPFPSHVIIQKGLETPRIYEIHT